MSDDKIKNEYRFNSRFKRYVDRYCASRGISVEEALTHKIVKRVCMSYTDL